MGGQSSSQTSQQSQTAPWMAAQPMLNGIMGQLNGLIPNSGINSAQTGALNSVEANAANGNPYAPQIGGYASNLLNGGGANAQAPMVNNAYQQYQAQTNPLASNTNYDPTQTPGVQAAMQAIQQQVGDSVNSQFAGAGRDLSGANQQAYGRGIAQAEAPLLLNQYNQNVQNQQGTAGNLYNAGNSTAGQLSGMQQNYLGNQGQGINAAQNALQAQNYGANQTLAAEAQRQGIPAQQLGLLAQIGVPIAGLGSQSSGTGNTTNQMSGAQQFATILQGIGSLIPKGPMSFNF